MVNTFFTERCSESSTTSRAYTETFEKSARNLDTQRLHKQCLEAYQILNILYQFNLLLVSSTSEKIQKEMERNQPSHPSTAGWSLKREIEKSIVRAELTKHMRALYLAGDTRFVSLPSSSHSSPKYELIHKDEIGHKVTPKDLIECSECSNLFDERKVLDADQYSTATCGHTSPLIFHLLTPPKRNALGAKHFTPLSGDYAHPRYPKRKPYSIMRKRIYPKGTDIVSSGFGQHPISKMWIGYETSLFHYINAHIAALEERGRSIRLSHVELFDRLRFLSDERANTSPEHITPWWITHTDSVMMSHRASLIRKELRSLVGEKVGEKAAKSAKEQRVSNFPPQRPLPDGFTLLPSKEEKGWYLSNPSIVNTEVLKWIPYGYVWTTSLKLTASQMERSLSSNSPSWDICAKPQFYDPSFLERV